MSNVKTSPLPLLATSKISNSKVGVACKVGENWIEKTGANFSLAKGYLENELTKRGIPVPSEWNVVDYTKRQAPAPQPPIAEDGLISPRAKEWLPVFNATYNLVQGMYQDQKGQDAWNPKQFRDDVDNRLKSIGFHPAFAPLGNGRPALTLAGITDPMVRPPQPGEGDRRKFKGINGYERDSQGRAYFEAGSKARPTKIETFKDFREEEARPSAATAEEVQALLDGGMDRKELRASERRLLGRKERGQNRKSKPEKRTLPKQAYEAGKALSKAALASGKDRTFWYKVGIVATLRTMKEEPHSAYEAQVRERLQENGYDPDEFLANGALKLIATALGEASKAA